MTVVQAMVPEGIDTSQPAAVYLTTGNTLSQEGVTVALTPVAQGTCACRVETRLAARGAPR